MTRWQAERLTELHQAGYHVHHEGSRLSQWKTDFPSIVLVITGDSACLDSPYCWVPLMALNIRDFEVFRLEPLPNAIGGPTWAESEAKRGYGPTPDR